MQTKIIKLKLDKGSNLIDNFIETSNLASLCLGLKYFCGYTSE